MLLFLFLFLFLLLLLLLLLLLFLFLLLFLLSPLGSEMLFGYRQCRWLAFIRGMPELRDAGAILVII